MLKCEYFLRQSEAYAFKQTVLKTVELLQKGFYRPNTTDHATQILFR